MIQGILIGLGAGYAIYSAVTWIAKHLISDKESDLINPDETASAQRRPLAEPSAEPKEETPAPVPEVELSVDQGADSATAFQTPADEPPKNPDTQVTDEAQAGKQWFLVKSNKGYLRATLLRSKTLKAVAGPFPTKEAALQAKELYVATD